MLRLFLKVLATITVFAGVLAVLGGGFGTVEITLWTLLLAAAVIIVVKRHRAAG
ncbi:hypothetical protein [Streptomyces turgidiscabies]|uniref:Uncharacterized protein n=1 Tax=Streptomyces turgidiscabies TaxID=85558 RepID=A0ABU0RFW4_9ACTN|nr:hypothetical protein [Streptomyces turgidiscabies]MDQ0930861.1 hypothetical protein [Streptomyces turgidiscabies]